MVELVLQATIQCSVANMVVHMNILLAILLLNDRKFLLEASLLVYQLVYHIAYMELRVSHLAVHMKVLATVVPLP